MSKIIIAIDGHSSCGKSTMAKALAQQVGYIYVDSGAMYRAVTLFALRHQLFNADGSVKAEQLQSRMSEVKVHFKLDPTTNLPVTYLNEERVEDEIRTLEVSQHVSPIAALPFVREAMTAAQQAMGEEKGIVMVATSGLLCFLKQNSKSLSPPLLKCVRNAVMTNSKRRDCLLPMMTS